MATRTKLWDGTRILNDAFGGATNFTVHHCGTCGVIFAVQDAFDKARRRDHRSFYCPGCAVSFSYGHESEEERLRRLLREESDRRAAAAASRDQAQADARAQKAAKTRFKNQRDQERVKAHAGVCPVAGCSRHFKDLARHMKAKHPDFTEEAA